MITPDRPLEARSGMKGRPMRWVICALLMLGFAPRAFAQDFDILRGSESVGPATFNNWSGFYLGGQWGYTDAFGDFSNATSGPIAFALRETALENNVAPSNWPVLGNVSGGQQSFGGFFGYNTQWQDLTLGVEVDLEHTAFALNATGYPISRMVSDDAGNTYDLTLNGSGSLNDVNYLTLRGRAGWILGNFLPYGFIGLAVGEGNLAVTATASGIQNPPSGGGTCSPANNCVPFSFTATVGRADDVLYGGAVGAGVDIAIMRNVFLRSEFEYLRFAPVSNVVVGATTIRIGGGLKF
jgi:outer membrane immunogenic protein